LCFLRWRVIDFNAVTDSFKFVYIVLNEKPQEEDWNGPAEDRGDMLPYTLIKTYMATQRENPE
jgi:hypothetical protein